MSKIDIVVTWVDGNDPVWKAEKQKYEKIIKGDSRDSRFRDWDNLRYWFRGIEKFAPWANKIYFVTQGHLPSWLNTDHPKLRIARHDSFIPSEFLPTFSCRPIEFNLHRIPGLSERFVYFNDDMFLTAPTVSGDFFRKGLPCDTGVLNSIIVGGSGRDGERLSVDSMYISNIFNTAVINRNFKKKDVLKKNWKKWFTPIYGAQMLRTLLLMPWPEFPGFMNPHLPYSYLKQTYKELWEHEEAILRDTCMHKFRDPTDVSSRLLNYWQVCRGNFTPRSFSIGKHFALCGDNKKNQAIFETIRSQKYKVVCVNDGYSDNDYLPIKNALNASLHAILPNRSSFEKES